MILRRRQTLDATAMTFDGERDDEDNRAQRLLLTLVLDTSTSMRGRPIAELNQALADMVVHLRHDVQLSAITEVALVTFGDGGVRAWRADVPVPPGTSPFVPVGRLKVPRLRAGGVTPMVEAIERAMACVTEEKRELKRRHLQYYCPHIWLLSDGVPTDEEGHYSEAWRPLAQVIAGEEAKKRFVFFAAGVADIDESGDAILQQITPTGHLSLKGMDFARVLSIVSSSAESAARGDDAAAIKRTVTNIQRRAEKV